MTLDCKTCNIEMTHTEGDESTVPRWTCPQCGKVVTDIHHPMYPIRLAAAFAYFAEHPEKFQEVLADVVAGLEEKKEDDK